MKVPVKLGHRFKKSLINNLFKCRFKAVYANVKFNAVLIFYCNEYFCSGITPTDSDKKM